ncbi:MAG: hypothetical protein IJ595_09610 [Oscillospiraceae bacterium]|nr:hypothetical protein [Oscillospiraceae bacterium]
MSNNYEDKNPAERFAEFLRLKNKLDAFNEKNQSELADRVFAQMCEAIREKGWNIYMKDADAQRIMLMMKAGGCCVCVELNLHKPSSTLVYELTFKGLGCLDPEKVPELAGTLVSINAEIRFGAFQYQEKTGEISLRYTQLYQGFATDVFLEVIDHLVTTAAMNYRRIARALGVAVKPSADILGAIREMFERKDSNEEDSLLDALLNDDDDDDDDASMPFSAFLPSFLPDDDDEDDEDITDDED